MGNANNSINYETKNSYTTNNWEYEYSIVEGMKPNNI